MERCLTSAPTGHILTHTGVWSHDGEWIVYDVRSDSAGERFDGDRIEAVHVETGDIRVVYASRHGACCGVVTCSPVDDRVVFIHGPENPTTDWSYAAWHRRGVVVHLRSGRAETLDARDLVPPFTPGALRGGTHVHVFSGDGQWVSFTYEDHLLARTDEETMERHINLRNVGVCLPGAVRVPSTHPRNHDGTHFAFLVTRTTAHPLPGSDEIRRAFSDAWVGINGYIDPAGNRIPRAIAFQGDVLSATGAAMSELFIVDIPETVTSDDEALLAGTETTRPEPPRACRQRRLTFTAHRRYPGLQGPRHWARSSADGSRIAFLMRDDSGRVQIWTVSPTGGDPMQVTDLPFSVQSAFSWSPDGRSIAFIGADRVCVVDVRSGDVRFLTAPDSALAPPRPEACVFSPDGRHVAYVRPVVSPQGIFNQLFMVEDPGT